MSLASPVAQGGGRYKILIAAGLVQQSQWVHQGRCLICGQAGTGLLMPIAAEGQPVPFLDSSIGPMAHSLPVVGGSQAVLSLNSHNDSV